MAGRSHCIRSDMVVFSYVSTPVHFCGMRVHFCGMLVQVLIIEQKRCRIYTETVKSAHDLGQKHVADTYSND